MKKCLQFVLMLMFPLLMTAQDTIVGWSFPQALDTSAYANFGTSSNLGARFISAEDTAGTLRTITWTNGVTSGDYAATAEGWDDGANVKFWAIKFKAVGYKDLKVYSKQRSGGNNPGPHAFVLQYRFSGGEYMNIPDGDTVLVANDWTTGVVANLALPEDCNDTNTSIYIRWLQVSNLTQGGVAVNDSGVSKIDDIYILGTVVSSGVEEADAAHSLQVYPNPANDYLMVEATENSVLRLCDLVGNVVSETRMNAASVRLDISDLRAGMYFLSATDPATRNTITRKVIVK